MRIRTFESELLKDYTFVNECGSTRIGFYHKSTLIRNSSSIGEAKICYINRSWEYYTYQTSMLKCVEVLINERIEHLKEVFKSLNNISKLTEKYKNSFDEYVAQDELMATYNLIKAELKYEI